MMLWLQGDAEIGEPPLGELIAAHKAAGTAASASVHRYNVLEAHRARVQGGVQCRLSAPSKNA
jgi:hypothetical protein